VDILLVPLPVYCSSGVGLRLLVKLEKSLLDRGSPLLCVVRDKTRVGLDIVGEAKVFMAHFVTIVTKPDTDTFSLFLVLNVLDMFLTHTKPGGKSGSYLYTQKLLLNPHS